MADEELLSPPRDWPACFKTAGLQRMLQTELAGRRVRLCGPPTGAELAAVAKLTTPTPTDSARNAEALRQLTGWPVVSGFALYEKASAADAPASERYVALPHHWNFNDSLWVDCTPRQAGRNQLVLVESAKVPAPPKVVNGVGSVVETGTLSHEGEQFAWRLREDGEVVVSPSSGAEWTTRIKQGEPPATRVRKELDTRERRQRKEAEPRGRDAAQPKAAAPKAAQGYTAADYSSEQQPGTVLRGVSSAVAKEFTHFDAAGSERAGLKAGTRVELHGLQGKPQLNGKQGVVTALSADSERIQVTLWGEGVPISVKAANLLRPDTQETAPQVRPSDFSDFVPATASTPNDQLPPQPAGSTVTDVSELD